MQRYEGMYQYDSDVSTLDPRDNHADFGIVGRDDTRWMVCVEYPFLPDAEIPEGQFTELLSDAHSYHAIAGLVWPVGMFRNHPVLKRSVVAEYDDTSAFASEVLNYNAGTGVFASHNGIYEPVDETVLDHW